MYRKWGTLKNMGRMDISVQTVPPISVYECQAFRSISATHFGSNDATIPVLTVPL